METKQQPVKQDAIKVLIADDDAPTRMLLSAAISQWGYDVTVVKDGEEAWEKLQDKDNLPRLLILDWMMPKLDGIALTERIKQELGKHPYIYIILLTQKTGAVNIIKSLEAGADAYLAKPFDMTELRSRLTAGARMIAYDNQITEQNNQLKKYFSHVETLEAALIKFKGMLCDAELNSEVDKLLDIAVTLKKRTRKND